MGWQRMEVDVKDSICGLCRLPRISSPRSKTPTYPPEMQCTPELSGKQYGLLVDTGATATAKSPSKSRLPES